MGKLAQIAIIVIIFGGTIVLTGLFPSLLGLENASGIGVLQTLTILLGFALMVGGAYLYAQSSYYPNARYTLAQRIAARLTPTGAA
jgi:hypothetical protein